MRSIAGLVVVGLGQRHVPHVADAREIPGVDPEFHVHAPGHRRHFAYRPGAEMLVALGGSVAGRVRHADEGDVAVARVPLDGAAKEGGDVPPVEALEHELVGVRQLGRGHPSSPVRYGRASTDSGSRYRTGRFRRDAVRIRSGPLRDDRGRHRRATLPCRAIEASDSRREVRLRLVPGRRSQSLSPFSPRPIARSPDRTTSMIALRSSALMKASSLVPSPVTSMM